MKKIFKISCFLVLLPLVAMAHILSPVESIPMLFGFFLFYATLPLLFIGIILSIAQIIIKKKSLEKKEIIAISLFFIFVIFLIFKVWGINTSLELINEVLGSIRKN